MRGTRVMLIVATGVVVASLGVNPGVAQGGTPPECSLLDNAEAMAHISGAGESALLRRCGERGGTTSADPVGPTTTAPNILVNARTADTYPHITQSETSVGANGQSLLLGFNDSAEFPRAGDFTGYATSSDGGATWTDRGAPATPLGAIDAVFGDPVVGPDLPRDVGQSSVFYFANLGQAGSRAVIAVHKTVDGGQTWTSATDASPGSLGGEFPDKEWLAVDSRATGPGAGNVYACWRRFGGGGGIRFSSSTDGGATFQEVTVNLSEHSTLVQGCQVAVDPGDGTVYVAWRDGFMGAPTIRLRRSADFGVTFGPEVVAGTAEVAETLAQCGRAVRTAFVDAERGALTRAVRSTSFPSLAVDPNSGDVSLAWHRAALAGGAGADVAVVRSTDGGQTFSAPTRVNADVAGHQFFASLAITPGGEVAVDYYSTQNSPTNRLIDTFQVRSADGGVTWTPPVRLTDVSFDRPRTNPNFDVGVAPCYMGDYNALAGAADGSFLSAWGDNRLDGNLRIAGLQPDPDIRFDRR